MSTEHRASWTIAACVGALASLLVVTLAPGAEESSSPEQPAYYGQLRRLKDATKGGKISDADLQKWRRDIFKEYRGKSGSYGIWIPPSFEPVELALVGCDLAFVDSWRVHFIVTRTTGRKYTRETAAGLLVADLGGDYDVISASTAKEPAGTVGDSVVATVRIGGLPYRLVRICFADSKTVVDFLELSKVPWEKSLSDPMWDQPQYRPVLIEFLKRTGLLARRQATAGLEQALRAARIGVNDPQLKNQLDEVYFQRDADISLFWECMLKADVLLTR